MLLHLGPQTSQQPDLHSAPQAPTQAPLEADAQACSQAASGIPAQVFADFAPHDGSQDCFEWMLHVSSQSDAGASSHRFHEDSHECFAGADG